MANKYTLSLTLTKYEVSYGHTRPVYTRMTYLLPLQSLDTKLTMQDTKTSSLSLLSSKVNHLSGNAEENYEKYLQQIYRDA